MRPFSLSLAVAMALATVAWVAAPARAIDETKPVPSCAGMTATDPAGDAVLQEPITGTGLLPVADNLDVTGAFFRYDPDPEGTPTLTANIKVANLDKTVPAGATGVNWYFFWTVADMTYYVTAGVDTAGGVTYSHGSIDPILTDAGATKGKFFEGPDGIIQMDVPQGPTKAGDGATLRSPYVSSRVRYDLVAVGVLPTADDAPDSQAGKSYKVAPCGGGSAAATSGELPVRLGTTSARASKAKKGKTLSLKLLASERVSALKAKMTAAKKSTTYGTGKLATLDGSGTLKIKLKRAMKKGSYKLALTGRNAAGESAKATFTLKVR